MTDTKNTLIERREHSRAAAEIEIEFKKDIDFVTSYMLNISKGGLFVKTDDAYPLDTIVLLRFTMPGDTQPIETEGKVVWSNSNKRKGYFPRGMGMKFLKLEPTAAEKIKKFVDEHFAQIQHHSIL
jgi:type IV pilus assembly protein PilZ